MRLGARCKTWFAAAGLVLGVGWLSAPQASAADAPGSPIPTARPSATPHLTTSASSVRLCPPVTEPGRMTCMSQIRTAGSGGSDVRPNVWDGMFEPADLRSAYGLPSVSAGTRQTVAIVDAYDDPKAEADLAVYRSHYKLPPCTTASGCFRKVDQTGGTHYPAADAGWAGEISLDLDMVSAVCPNCRILLVEANSSYLSDLGTAVNTAVRLGAKYVSNSYGGTEYSGQTTDDVTYFDHPGVAITASTGDDGYGVSYPAASQYVTAVGGTTLAADGSVRGWGETAWNYAGSGCSAYEPKPSWQHDTACSGRTVADVSAVAAPGVVVYDSVPYQGYSGWLGVNGTSVSAPIVAATYALAGTPAASGYPASYPYTHPGALNDVTAGSNGACGTVLCTAGTGWDGPTGLGTPLGTASFSANGAFTGPVTSGVLGKCLNDNGNGTSDLNPIDVWTCNGSAGQNWTTGSDGTVQINGKCLTVKDGGTANGSKAVLSTCDASGSQEWRPKTGGQLVNPQSGRCLDDPGGSKTNGTQLDIWDCVAKYNEQWTPPYAVPTSTGPVTSQYKTSLCVDDKASKTANGTPIQIYTCNGTNAQKLTIAADGSLRILGKCLDVPGYKTANGTKIDLWSCVGQTNEQWRVLGNGALVNPESGRCLDDPGFSTKPGTRLDIWDCAYSKNELWNLPKW